MRDIIFRGKRVDNGEWVYGSLITLSQGTFICDVSSYNTVEIDLGERLKINALWEENDFVEVIPETIGQYTGLTDKNGKNIFEGDIVAIYDKYNKLDSICFIEFHKYAYCCVQYLYGKKYYDLLKAEQRDECGEIFDIYSYEVISNIHDKPEFLKEGDND